MTLPDIDPILLQIGPVAIHWYALAYIVGIALGWWYLHRLINNEALWGPKGAPLDNTRLEDMVLWLALGIIVGGRIGYILFYDLAAVMADPLRAFRVWEGGMAFHGGFMGVVIAALLYARAQKINPWSLGDLLACAAPIGLFLGRMANFVNGELWGRPTDAPWGIVFCNSYTPINAQGACIAGLAPRHPSQLYEAALEGLLLFVILFVLTHVYKKLRQPGLLMGIFIAGYGLSRILVETVRNPDEHMTNFQVITMGMILSTPMVLAGLVIIALALKGKTQGKPD
ncbi:prolipoprotein diacylglyceryl transferase [Asticcacaulis tiandongensis]|uniref:prolipoprotein diacylglyceryl transferase n=1 Tax=Asticcacaulis tiandongensis TaxID=2565365 RepID=UPI00112A88D3|nr:prolipoprotein diacylglyceryl transferase [Asticcacaulis tiandongensis]